MLGMDWVSQGQEMKETITLDCNSRVSEDRTRFEFTINCEEAMDPSDILTAIRGLAEIYQNIVEGKNERLDPKDLREMREKSH